MEDREREAEIERRKGKNVQVGYMKMWVNGRMKRWDEIEDGMGKAEEEVAEGYRWKCQEMKRRNRNPDSTGPPMDVRLTSNLCPMFRFTFAVINLT
ncbi:hypothetical protein EAI_04479 [Harpegnathos saltator]|uniref:Uncharacterized protein n=1 Tax=Harpegnathos saltator TaxID=610380 RepID=E2BBV7_HARSA|nr:hypothetical protein EAI_04479 [Harpegnathos saltator]